MELSGNGPMTTVTATCSSIVGTTSFTGGSTLTIIGLCNATGPRVLPVRQDQWG